MEFILQARNKPADGSGHLTQKQREKTPSGQKGGAPAKASAHSAKQPAPAKQTPSNKSSTQTLYKPQPKPIPKQKPKKKKNQQHDLIVTIDLVSINIHYVFKFDSAVKPRVKQAVLLHYVYKHIV